MRVSGEHRISETASITVNGKTIEILTARGLPQLLEKAGVDPEKARGVAVAVNEEVVPRASWADVQLKEGDRVEVVTAKQGG